MPDNNKPAGAPEAGAAESDRRVPEPEPSALADGSETPKTDASKAIKRFADLCELERGFLNLWRKRHDASTAFAIAEIGHKYEWPDSDIVALLMSHGGEHAKSGRYYERVVARARAARPWRADEDNEIPVIDRINERLQMPHGNRIIAIKRYTSEPAQYGVELQSGSIIVGGITGLCRWKRLYYHLMDLAGVQIPSFKPRQWAEISKLLRQAAVNVSVGEEGTDVGLIKAQLRDYLEANTILAEYDPADSTEVPFVKDGRICIFGAGFRNWVRKRGGELWEPISMGTALRRAEAEAIKVPHARSSRQVWRLPAADFPPPQSTIPVETARERADQFITERLVLDGAGTMTAGEVRAAYALYIADYHILDPVAESVIAARLKIRGGEHDHNRRGNFWRGVRLRDAETGLLPQ